MTFEEMRLSQADYTKTLVDKLTRKMACSLANARGADFIPYTVRDNKWVPAGPAGRKSIGWWTNGFWPGEMWEMYRLTKDEAPEYVRGDVDGDNNVNISDVTTLIDILLSGSEAPASADCDGDSQVNISDVTTLIDYLLSGNWPAEE